MLSCEVFNQLHGLSLCHILVFNVDPYVLDPGLEDQVCCGRITTLQFADFWLCIACDILAQPFAYHIWVDILCWLTNFLWLYFVRGASCVSSPTFAADFRGVDVKSPLLTACKVHMVGMIRAPCGLFSQFILKIFSSCHRNILA